MCIRDSVFGGGAGVPDAGAVGDDFVGGRIAASEAGGGPDPVSYTHLRAHETVLDLVCRLLLEKKKRLIMHYHASPPDEAYPF